MDMFSLECHVIDGEIHCDFQEKRWSENTGWGSRVDTSFTVDDAETVDDSLQAIDTWFRVRLGEDCS